MMFLSRDAVCLLCEGGIKMEKSTCFICEHLDDEYVCEIKNKIMSPDSESCKEYKWCGYDILADSYFFS